MSTCNMSTRFRHKVSLNAFCSDNIYYPNILICRRDTLQRYVYPCGLLINVMIIFYKLVWRCHGDVIEYTCTLVQTQVWIHSTKKIMWWIQNPLLGKPCSICSCSNTKQIRPFQLASIFTIHVSHWLMQWPQWPQYKKDTRVRAHTRRQCIALHTYS